MDIHLLAVTGNNQLDDLLLHMISLFERSIPARVRSYYLGGSYSDGTAVGHNQSPNSSDLDLFIIFRHTVAEDEHAHFQRLVTECRRNSPIQIDAHAYSEDDLLQKSGQEMAQVSFLNALIRVAGVLVYGEDLRPLLPDIPFSRYILDVIESGIFHLGIPRQREQLAYPLVTPLTPPLTYPDPTGEFYGYDLVPVRPNAPRGTRVLVALTAWIATLILALETGRYAGQKSQSIQLCKKYLPNDTRVQLAATINDFCKGTWGYELPDSAEDRTQLQKLCREVLSLENEYLQIVYDYLLNQLQRGGVQEKKQALHILQSVVYRDNEMLQALRTLMYSSDQAVQEDVAKALKIGEEQA